MLTPTGVFLNGFSVLDLSRRGLVRQCSGAKERAHDQDGGEETQSIPPAMFTFFPLLKFRWLLEGALALKVLGKLVSKRGCHHHFVENKPPFDSARRRCSVAGKVERGYAEV